MQCFEHWIACVTSDDSFMARVLKNDLKVLKLVAKWLLKKTTNLFCCLFSLGYLPKLSPHRGAWLDSVPKSTYYPYSLATVTAKPVKWYKTRQHKRIQTDHRCCFLIFIFILFFPASATKKQMCFAKGCFICSILLLENTTSIVT